MAKQSSINKNNYRRMLVAQNTARRAKLKSIIGNEKTSAPDRMQATIKLAQMPRNSSKTRIRNRCEVTGRSRGFYRKLKLCRNQLRELASQGMIPGMTKSSW
jgi:small subunit ribosomal protein S14